MKRGENLRGRPRARETWRVRTPGCILPELARWLHSEAERLDVSMGAVLESLIWTEIDRRKKRLKKSSESP